MTKFGFFILILACLGTLQEENNKGQFKLMEESQLYLVGSSNVNRFKCFCKESFPVYEFNFRQYETDPHSAVFNQTLLKLPAKKFDCGHNGMNKDLHAALNAGAFPAITIQLNKVHLSKDCDFTALQPHDETSISATTTITIAGQSREEPLQLKVKKLSERGYHLTADRSMFMTDYGITPPNGLTWIGEGEQ